MALILFRQGIGGGHHAAEILVPRIGQIIRKAEYPEAVVEKLAESIRQVGQAPAESIKTRAVKTMDVPFLPDNGAVFHPGIPDQGYSALRGQNTAAFPLERGGVKPVERLRRRYQVHGSAGKQGKSGLGKVIIKK